MTAPIIAIPAGIEPITHGPWNENAAYVPAAYMSAVQRAGAIALLIPPDPALTSDPSPILDRVHGLLLAGGVDVDPASYGAEAHPETTGVTPARDAMEIALVRAALARDMPVLGICRGLQILNVAAGGTLIQHVPDVVGGSSEHRRNPGTFTGNGHPAALVPDSLAAASAGSTTAATLSHHHQAVDCVGAGLVVTGRAADGIIEAAEDPSHAFVLGVQWHPEADASSPVVGSLVEAARRYQG